MIIPFVRPERRVPTPQAEERFTQLQHMLTVVGGLPAGAPGDRLRRAVCEAIEADTERLRRERLTRLLADIDGIQDGQRRSAQAGAPADAETSTLLTALGAAVRSLIDGPLGQ